MLRIFGHFLPIPPMILAITEAILVSIAICLVIGPGLTSPAGFDATRVQFALLLSLAVIAAMVGVGLYSADAFLDRRIALVRVLIAVILAAPIAFMIRLLFEALSESPSNLGPHWALKAFAAWLICLGATRTMFSRFSDLEIFKRRILVLGSGARAFEIQKLAKTSPQIGFKPIAFVRACDDRRLVRSIELSAGPHEDALRNVAHDLGAQEVVIATDERRGLPVQQLLRCKLGGIDVVDYVGFCERETGRADLEALQPSWFILSDGFRFGPIFETAKRAFDIAVSVSMLIVVLPVLCLTMLAIRLESAGPILYRQERVGLRGRRFVLLKFRSMRFDAEADGSPKWAERGDLRVTRIGAFIRKFRIDELPQLLNVIRGDMAVVGPRPERPYFVEQLTQQIRFYNERHAVRPGITGWAQINYPYGASVEDARQKLSYDLYYLKNRSLFLDLVILVQTARVILWSQGAR